MFLSLSFISVVRPAYVIREWVKRDNNVKNQTYQNIVIIIDFCSYINSAESVVSVT